MLHKFHLFRIQASALSWICFKRTKFRNYTYGIACSICSLSGLTSVRKSVLLAGRSNLDKAIALWFSHPFPYIIKKNQKIRFFFISGRRGSNPRRQPWEGCILPLNYPRSDYSILANKNFFASVF